LFELFTGKQGYPEFEQDVWPIIAHDKEEVLESMIVETMTVLSNGPAALVEHLTNVERVSV